MKNKKTLDASQYNISIRKGNFDGEIFFEAKIKELPDVAEYADTHEEAYSLAIDTIETTAEALAEQGKVMPSPIIEENSYSGRVTLRMPKSMHAAFASWSESEEVSLNQLIVDCLSFNLGKQFGTGHKLQLVQPTIGSQRQTSFLSVGVENKPKIMLIESKRNIPLNDYNENRAAYG